MRIKFNTAIIFTGDIAASKEFYHVLLGLTVLQDADTFVLLEGNLGLHKADVFYEYIGKQYGGRAMGRDNLDLYFTADDIEAAERRLKDAGVKFIHGIKEFPWGEKLFRVYDPDGHIVEIGDAGQSAPS
jgi:catechol 2,3-dioxygenase-like lactoylglutathione lyase family enzyme